MLFARRSFIQLSRIGWIAVLPVFLSVSVFAQSVASPPAQSPLVSPQAAAPAGGAPAASEGNPGQAKTTTLAPAQQAAAHETVQAPCAPNADVSIPVSATIRAKVTGPMDSGHLKVGKEFWLTVQKDIAYPGCKLNTGSAIYGHVTSASSQKNSTSSELSLAFDHADCYGLGKKAMPLWLIGLMGPSEEYARMHDDLPMGELDNRRSAKTAAKILTFNDFKLNPGGAPNTVHPGIVLGLPKLKLEVQGGPGCSGARISSTDHSAVLEMGSELILVPESKP
jgi:hypothetical protein